MRVHTWYNLRVHTKPDQLRFSSFCGNFDLFFKFRIGAIAVDADAVYAGVVLVGFQTDFRSPMRGKGRAVIESYAIPPRRIEWVILQFFRRPVDVYFEVIDS